MARFTRAEVRKIVGENCTDEIENALVALHLGVVDPIKDELEKYKADAEKVPDLEKKLEEAEKGDYKAKYEAEHKAYEDYKKSVDAEKGKAAKETAARKYLEEKGVKGTNLEIAVRGARDEINGLEVDNDGKIKSTKALDDLLSGTFKGLVVTESAKGANVAKPFTSGGSNAILTKEEIYKKDDKGRYVLDAAERQKAIADALAAERK